MSQYRKILIADCDKVFRSTMATVLERAGYACTSTSNVESIIEQITQEDYDLLLVDISEPHSPSCLLLDALRSQPASFPLIVMTRRPSFDSALKAVHWQVNDYLVKPFEIQQLLTAIQKALTQVELYKLAQQVQRQWQTYKEKTQTRAATQDATSLACASPIEAQLAVALDALSRGFTERQHGQNSHTAYTEQVSLGSLSSFEFKEQAASNGQIDHSTVIRQSQREKRSDHMEHLDNVRARLELLSRREWEVVQLLLANQRPKAIARSLFISLHTVRNHLRSIFEKLAVHSQTELLMLLGRHALLPSLEAETDVRS
jgi:DNA-binding NarL/FixJ family response regulator